MKTKNFNQTKMKSIYDYAFSLFTSTLYTLDVKREQLWQRKDFTIPNMGLMKNDEQKMDRQNI